MSISFGGYFPAAIAGILFILFSLQCDYPTHHSQIRPNSDPYQLNCGGASILDFAPKFDMPMGAFFRMAFG